MTNDLVDNNAVKRLVEEWRSSAAREQERAHPGNNERKECNGEDEAGLFEELDATFSALDAIKACVPSTADTPVQFVFMGGENSGKSKILEQIVKMSLLPSDRERSARMINKI